MCLRFFLLCLGLLTVATAKVAAEGKEWPLPSLKPDSSLRPAIEKALEPSIYSRWISRDTRDPTLVVVMMQIDRPPTDMAFEMSVRSGGQTWPVGPMAWKKGQIKWWSYQLDLPESITHVDVVFTPSARAGMIMSRFPTWPIKDLTSIWSGDPIVNSNVKIRSQDLTMSSIRPPGAAEMREHLVDAFLPGGDTAGQLDAGATLEEIRTRLDGQTAQPGASPRILYELGCVMIGQGELEDAMETLVKTRDAPELAKRLQRELRYICARWLDAADKGRLPEMVSLGRAYEAGNGVGKDAQQAKYWYRRASNAGSAEAAKRLGAMPPPSLKNADAAEKARAEYRSMAEEWRQKVTITYEKWLEENTNTSSTRRMGGRDKSGELNALKMVITRFYGDEEGKKEQDFRSSESSAGVELTVDGHRYGFSHDSWSTRGSSSSQPMPEKILNRIDQLAASLPDDGGVLPLPNRRVLIEVLDKAQPRYRVYDRATAPDEVFELIRLLNAGHAYVPEFPAHSSIHVRDFDEGVLAVTPQNEILFTGHRERLQWWNPVTREFIAEADVDDVEVIAFSPDKIHALVRSNYDTVLIDLPARRLVRKFEGRYGAQFTQDGKHAVLQSTHKRPVQILDTQTWEPVARPDNLPEEWSIFFPAPSIPRTIARSADGSVALWDTERRQPIKQLGTESTGSMAAAFSPDESLVAVYFRPGRRTKSDPRVSIALIDSGSGKHVRELLVLGTGGHGDAIDSLLWTPGGDYVVAVTGSSGGGSGISVFNAQTGRHRGQLTKASRIHGIGLIANSGELVAGDTNGRIWFWSLPDVLEFIRDFEVSLAPNPD